MRGVPGAVGVGVGDDDPDCAVGAVGLGSWGLLKVEVDAVAWCVGWRYGERDWAARWVCEAARVSSFMETLLIVSRWSSGLLRVFKGDDGAAELVMVLGFCMRGHTRLAIASRVMVMSVGGSKHISAKPSRGACIML